MAYVNGNTSGDIQTNQNNFAILYYLIMPVLVTFKLPLSLLPKVVNKLIK